MTTTLNQLKEKATHHANRYEQFARIGAMSIMAGAGILISMPQSTLLTLAPLILPLSALPLYIGAFHGVRGSLVQSKVNRVENLIDETIESVRKKNTL